MNGGHLVSGRGDAVTTVLQKPTTLYLTIPPPISDSSVIDGTHLGYAGGNTVSLFGNRNSQPSPSFGSVGASTPPPTASSSSYVDNSTSSMIIGPGPSDLAHCFAVAMGPSDLKLPNSPPSPNGVLNGYGHLHMNGGGGTTNGRREMKQEPLSSSSSEDGGAVRPFQPVPLCAICAADSTGIHFGVEACAACSAFFRRTVVLGKKYTCAKGGGCPQTKVEIGTTRCRACRFTKCITVGMDRTAVQHRRDAIGKVTQIKQEFSPMNEYDLPGPSLPKPKSTLEDWTERYEELCRLRKLFYTTTSMAEALDPSTELEPKELTQFRECIFQVWKIEPRIVQECLFKCEAAKGLTIPEKTAIYRNFYLIFQAIEEPFFTWKNGGLEKNWWFMQNMTYFDLNHPDDYFDNFVLKGLNIDKGSAKAIFVPSFRHAMDTVGRRMQSMNLSRTEMIALAAFTFLNRHVPDLSEETKEIFGKASDQLIKDILEMYEKDDTIKEDPEVRLYSLLSVIGDVKVHALRTKENMRMLDFFSLLPSEPLLQEINDIQSIELTNNFVNNNPVTKVLVNRLPVILEHNMSQALHTERACSPTYPVISTDLKFVPPDDFTPTISKTLNGEPGPSRLPFDSEPSIGSAKRTYFYARPDAHTLVQDIGTGDEEETCNGDLPPAKRSRSTLSSSSDIIDVVKFGSVD